MSGWPRPSGCRAPPRARVQAGALTVRVRHASFEQWWEPFTLGVGPAGEYLRTLSPEHRDALRGHCQRLLPAGPGETTATAWAAISLR